MNNYPNIFDYATKELTQDAMICWFLSCLNNDNVKVKEIGKNFLTEFVFKEQEEYKFNCNDIIKNLNSSNNINIKIYSQCSNIDVLAYVKIDNIVIPIIFEDKTDTFLHGNQFYKYCKKVDNWKSDETKSRNEKVSEYGFDFDKITDTIYILFKTGYISEYHKHEFSKQYDNIKKEFTQEDRKIKAKLIGKTDMLDFLKQLDTNNITDYVCQYKDYLRKKEEDDEKSYETCDMTSHIGHFRFFYEYCGFTVGSIHCERQRDVYTYVTLFSKDGIDYCLRCQANGEKSCVYFQQYSTDMPENKISELENMKKLCNKIVKEINIKEELIEKVNMPKNDYKSARIFQVTFDQDKKSPQKVAKIIRELIYKLSVELNLLSHCTLKDHAKIHE